MAEKCYIDANVLVFFINHDSPFNLEAISILEDAVSRGYQLVISSLVLDEYIHAVNRMLQQQNTKQQAKLIHTAVETVLALPELLFVQPPTSIKKNMRVLEVMEKYTLRSRDAFHLLTMQEHNVKVLATFDTDFQHVFAQGEVRNLR